MSDRSPLRRPSMFDRFASEPAAILPPDAVGEMTCETTREMRAVEALRNRHWTARTAKWITRQLMRFNPYEK